MGTLQRATILQNQITLESGAFEVTAIGDSIVPEFQNKESKASRLLYSAGLLLKNCFTSSEGALFNQLEQCQQ